MLTETKSRLESIELVFNGKYIGEQYFRMDSVDIFNKSSKFKINDVYKEIYYFPVMKIAFHLH